MTPARTPAWATRSAGRVREARGDQRRAELGLVRDADRLPVAGRLAAADGGEAVAVERVVHDPHGGLAVDLDRDRDPVARVPVQVVRGPVDRVDDPADAGGRLGARALLGEHPVAGSLAPDPVDDQALAGLVDLGDHVGRRRLRAHARARLAQALEREPGRLGGQVPGKREQRLELGHRRSSGRPDDRHAAARSEWFSQRTGSAPDEVPYLVPRALDGHPAPRPAGDQGAEHQHHSRRPRPSAPGRFGSRPTARGAPARVPGPARARGRAGRRERPPRCPIRSPRRARRSRPRSRPG